jgi:hypothetical protein
MNSNTWRLFPLLFALLAACETTERRAPVVSDAPSIRTATPARSWEVRERDEARGYVVLYSGKRDVDKVYVVRNSYHQDVGLIDARGRAYRYLPHHSEPAWVGSGTIAQGVARILELAEGECTLAELELESAARPAAPRQSP